MKRILTTMCGIGGDRSDERASRSTGGRPTTPATAVPDATVRLKCIPRMPSN